MSLLTACFRQHFVRRVYSHYRGVKAAGQAFSEPPRPAAEIEYGSNALALDIRVYNVHPLP